MTVTCEDIANALDAAYDLLDERGWGQGAVVAHDATDEDVPICVGQAILLASGPVGRKAYDAFTRWVGGSVVRFNDRSMETVVFDTLEACADWYRSNGSARVTSGTGRHGAR